MSEPLSHQELLEKHSQVLLLLESAHQEIRRQGQIIEAFQKRFFGSLIVCEKFCDSLPVLLCIQRIYRIEKQIKQGGSPPGCRKLIRLARIGPGLRELYAKISAASHPLILPKSKLGEALTYAHNQREKIEAILSDGNFELDTNLVENAIRITKVGLKNYLFFGNAEAGKQNAILYTLLENCKAHGLKPELYLSQTIEAINRLGSDATPADMAALTPSRTAARLKTEAKEHEKAA